MSYIAHITLSTGHTRQSPRAEVSPKTIRALKPWLALALESDAPYPLPGTLGSAEGFAMQASVLHGGLICHVSHEHDGLLVTFGVAARSRQAGELWAWMCAQYGSRSNLLAPGTPWCAVALQTGLALQSDAAQWLGDFERCVAWTWLDKS